MPHDFKVFEGAFTPDKDDKFAIVVSRFNSAITQRLLDGACDGLLRHAVAENNIEIVWVPGAFELPLVAKQLAASERFRAVLALGAVIRGATDHYDYVCEQTATGIAQASMASGIPVLFGVLTTDSIEQAVERSGTKAGNKGWDCALAALEMSDLMRQLAHAS